MNRGVGQLWLILRYYYFDSGSDTVSGLSQRTYGRHHSVVLRLLRYQGQAADAPLHRLKHLQ